VIVERHIKGHDVSACFGGAGCPNALGDVARLVSEMEALMAEADLVSFLKSRVKGDLKFHHTFRVSISGCPNACSRPQITDMGIIAAAVPGVTQAPCTQCECCVSACPDHAIGLAGGGPKIDTLACLCCGKCVRACPSGTLDTMGIGYRVLLGGRLGRHPRLGMDVPGIFFHDQVLDMLRRCLEFYKAHATEGQRFSHILKRSSQIVCPGVGV